MMILLHDDFFFFILLVCRLHLLLLHCIISSSSFLDMSSQALDVVAAETPRTVRTRSELTNHDRCWIDGGSDTIRCGAAGPTWAGEPSGANNQAEASGSVRRFPWTHSLRHDSGR